MAKKKDLRGMSYDDLANKIKELNMELMKLNSQVAAGTTPKSPGQLKQIKKSIARILTILKEKSNKEEIKKHE